MENILRRNFLKAAAMAATALAAPVDVWANNSIQKRVTVNPGETILFQGDSITDAGRKKDNKEVNNSAALGSGYSVLASADILKKSAGHDVKFYNRGVSGNKVYQLADRWQEDCLSLKPSVLSILIGVNDFWHMIDGKYDGTIEKYKADYIALLTRTKAELPGVKFVIGEPFAINKVKSVTDKWFPQFYAYQAAAREIAEQFDAAYIPYQSIFDAAQLRAPASYWTADGVHPTLAGSQLMAEAWLQKVKLPK